MGRSQVRSGVADLATGQRQGSPRSASPATAALIASIATLVFLLPWWNRFLGLSLDGYMPLYGWKILAGEMPYRDFYLHLPPLQPLLEAALQAVAGRSLLAVRLAGALGRIALAAITAAWLGRSVRPAIAAAASVSAVCLASADDIEILDLYSHHALVGAIASGWLASIALAGGRGARWAWIGSGAAAAAALWTKQTVGVGAALAVPVSLALLAVRGRRERAALMWGGVGFASGWVLFSMPLVAWLAVGGALGDFLRQVFVNASAAKGDLLDLVLRPWREPFELPDLVAPAAFGLGLALLGILVLRPRLRRAEEAPRSRRGSVLTIVALAGALAAAFLLAQRLGGDDPVRFAKELQQVVRVGLFTGLFGVLLLALELASVALFRRLDGGESELLLAAVVAVACAAMHALSFPATGLVALPSVAVVGILAVAGETRWRVPGRLRFAIAAVVAVAALAAAGIRVLRPFDFAGWRQPPVSVAKHPSRLAELRGLRLSSGTVAIVDGYVDLLRSVSRPGEPVFTFPVYPIFDWLADRPAATFAILHWIDVTPDAIVDADLERLRTAPPPAVVYQWVTERLLKSNETYFRHRRHSSMRRMRNAVARMLENQYVLAGHCGIPGSGSTPALQLWIRRDRAAEAGIEPLDPEVLNRYDYGRCVARGR